MKISDIKHLVSVLESRNVTDEFDLKFVCNLASPGRSPVIVDFALDETDNVTQRFDIGHSDKIANIFIKRL